jgi:sulfide:quinone oxidoreductase
MPQQGDVMMETARFRKLDDAVSVAGQIGPEDLRAARAAGVRTVINNRPDHEAPDQPTSAEMQAMVEAEGLMYRHVPLPNGGLTRDIAARFANALDDGTGPFLAYCRSGMRSTTLWALAAARREPVDKVIAAAAKAGYDLAGARPLLEQVAAEAQGDGPSR